MRKDKIGRCTWLLGLALVLGFAFAWSPDTLAQSVCGNSVIDPGEECDDGNSVSGDGCSAACVFEVCGNGTLDVGEQCDDGNNTNGDGCNAFCEDEKCGDGNLDPGEACDDGNNTDGDGCSSDCTIESPSCGNGTLDPGEECDDGNNTDGDGCSAECQDEEVGEGCTPGFWKNHHDHWQDFTPDQLVGSVFTGCSVFPTLADDSLDDALRYNGGSGTLGGARIMLRACTAALLNEAHDDVDYGVDGVIGLCNTACATQDRNTMITLGGLLDDANNDGSCPLSGGNTNSNTSNNSKGSSGVNKRRGLR